MSSDDSSVEQLKRKLFARSGGPAPRTRRMLHEEAFDVTPAWQHEEDFVEEQTQVTPENVLDDLQHGVLPSAHASDGPQILRDPRFEKNAVSLRMKQRTVSSVVYTIFLASVAFFLIAASIAGYFFFMGRNLVTSENVDIEIIGPGSLPAGEELILQIGVVNNNPVAMELVDLVVDFPSGTRAANNIAMDLPRLRESLGTIEPGSRAKSAARAVLFGPENSEHEITVSVQYRIKDSNAVFTRETPYTIRLSSAPVAVTVDGVKEISSGQEMTLTVDVTSNSEGMQSNILLTGAYPFGFEFRTAEPAPSFGNNVWDLGDLPPGTKRSIVIHGVAIGQDTEERVFRFEVGGQSQTNPEELVTAYQTVEHPLTIARPFVDLDLVINGVAGTNEVSVVPGSIVSGTINWANQLPYPLYDVEVNAVFDGPLLNLASVKAQGGFWRSMDRTLLWTSQTTWPFKQVNPGERGALTFNFTTAPLGGDTSARDPSLRILLTVKGRRVFEEDGSVPEIVSATAERTVKLGTDLALLSRVRYSGTPFTNIGPYPPRVHTETTYTVSWQVTNTTNDIGDASVRATLPLYVSWMGNISPTNEAISYNPTTHEITWRVGDVPAGTGYRTQAREVAFQVAFTPSISQRGQMPNLVENQKLRGVDRFTGAVVEKDMGRMTTSLTNDATFSGVGRVIE